MKKRLSIAFVVVLMLSLTLALSGCGNDIIKAPDSVKPVAQQLGKEFVWNHYTNADSYIAEINGVQENIGLPIVQTPSEGGIIETVIWEFNIQGRDEGVYKIKFATVTGNSISAFTDEFIVVIESDLTVNAPQIKISGSLLSIRGNGDITGYNVEIGGVKKEIYTTELSYSLDISTVEGLVNHETYIVKAQAKYDEKISAYSNSVIYIHTVNETAVPKIAALADGDYAMLFGKSYLNPTVQINLNGFTMMTTKSGLHSRLDFSDLSLPAEAVIELAKGNAKLSYKIIDLASSTESELSNEVVLDSEFMTDRAVNLSKALVSEYVRASLGGETLTVTYGYNADKLAEIFNVQVTVGDEPLEGLVIGGTVEYTVPNLAGINTLTVSAVFVNTEIETIEILSEKLSTNMSITGLKTASDGNGVRWDRLDGVTGYEVTYAGGGNSVTVAVETNAFDTDGLDAGKYTITVVGVKGDYRTAASSALTVTKLASACSVVINNEGKLLINTEAYKVGVTLYNGGGNEIESYEYDPYEVGLIDVRNLGEFVSVETVSLGAYDKINSNKSIHDVYFIDDIKYTVEGGSKLKLSDGSHYIDGNLISGSTFDLLEYLDKSAASSAVLSKGDESLSIGKNVVSMPKTITPDRQAQVAYSQVGQGLESVISWTERYLATFEYYIVDLNETIDGENYKTVKTADTTQNSFDIDDSELKAGNYRVYLRVKGYGDKYASKYVLKNFDIFEKPALEFDHEVGYTYLQWKNSNLINESYVVTRVHDGMKYEMQPEILKKGDYKRFIVPTASYDCIRVTVKSNRNSSYASAMSEIDINTFKINYSNIQDCTYYSNKSELPSKILVRERNQSGILGNFAFEKNGSVYNYNSVMDGNADDMIKLSWETALDITVDGLEYTDVSGLIVKKGAAVSEQFTVIRLSGDYENEFVKLQYDVDGVKVDLRPGVKISEDTVLAVVTKPIE